MRKVIPRSLNLFVFTAVWVALQAVPGVGLALLLLMAPFWSVLLINAGFIGIAGEALTNRVSRLWLIVPLVWYGGNAAFAAHDRIVLAQLRSEMAVARASVHVPFAPDREDLVLKDYAPASDLVANYRLPVIYSEGARVPDYKHTARFLIPLDMCNAVRNDELAVQAEIEAAAVWDKTGDPYSSGVIDERFCVLQMPQEPSHPALTVETTPHSELFNAVPVTFTTTTITAPDKRVYTFREASAELLPWFPLPVVGCFQWDKANCGAGFWRNNPVEVLPPHGLAEVLGLKRVAPQDRSAVAPDAVRMRIARTQETVVARQLAVLDAVLRNPKTKADSVPFPSLSRRTDLLLPRLPRMISAIERGVDGDGRDNAQQVFLLLHGLPNEAVAPYRQRLEAVWVKDPWFEFGHRPAPPDVLPDICKTPSQRGMSKAELQSDRAEQRNRTISDEDILAAYRHPECHVAIDSGDAILGQHNGATVALNWRNGHLVVFYTPGRRDVFKPGHGLTSESVPGQTCDTVGGVTVRFGPGMLCAPKVIAPQLIRDAASLPAAPREMNAEEEAQ